MNRTQTPRWLDALAVVAALLVSSGCDDSDGDDEGAALEPRGAITVTVSNATGAEVFVNVTYGTPFGLEGGPSDVQDRHDCTSLCTAGCSCDQCGAPQTLVRRIADGASLDVTWDGYTYERIACEQGVVTCYCDQKRAPELGTYTFTLSGRRAMDPPTADTAQNDPDLFVAVLDQTSDECTAELAVDLTETDQQVSTSFQCP